MKIAVAVDQGMIAEHFGHCEGFTIYTIEGNKIIEKEFISNPGHRPGFLPNYLNELGINIIIAGGMGGGAIQIFDEKGIKVITGATGEVDGAVQRFLDGKLKSLGSICHEHQHAGNCGGD